MPESMCVHQHFEQQVLRHPDASAVAFDGQQLSFSELNLKANQLAHELRALGVGPEITVAVLVERSLDLAVAVLAILKAGGAYVPLDTDQPNQRQAFILEDCQPAALVTQSHLKLGLLSDVTRIVHVDAPANFSGKGAQRENLRADVELQNLAYVLYTSGTTGKPKGVAVEHRQLMHYLMAAIDGYGLSKSDTFAMPQTIAVDTCITCLFTPLVIGKCLHLLTRECSLDPDALSAYCRENRIDCLKIAPSHLGVLLDSPSAADLLPHQHLVLGGEAPSWELLNRVRELRPRCAVFNEYGPTETTVGVITARLDNGSIDPESATPPIGTPIGGCEAYLLDDQLQPVGDGDEGELYIGGDQLARGYFRQPELTARVFIDDPHAIVPGARLYRTGDLARRLPDGNLEYTGRADRQTKIRGFRVEPGEIESVLGEHAAVRQSVVTTYSDPSGRKRLAAYVVLHGRAAVTATRLIHFLRQRLPDPMVPSTVLFLDGLPLLPQGKIDRKSLPLPQERRSLRSGQVTVARTATEAAVLEVWQDVLGVAPIGIDEDFFSLGGDSLLASTLLVRLRQCIGCRLSLATLFGAPTIEALAKVLDEGSFAEMEDELQPITPAARGAESPLSFGQERIWFIQKTNPESIAYSYGVKFCFEGELSVPTLERCLTEELRRHEIYRTSFHDSLSEPVQRVHPPWSVKLPLIDLTAWPEETRQAEAERQLDTLLREPFDLGRAPLVRWTLLRLDPHTHWLLHLENHLVHDGWASDVFFQELLDLYNAFRRGQPSPLLDPPLQYADFALWEKEWIHGAVAERQREYWRRTLADSQAQLALPTDHPRPAKPTYRGGRLDTELEDDLWDQLCALGRGERATLFIVTLAAFYTLLYHYTGQTDINLGTGAGNRRRPEVAGVLGMFINNLVLRMDLSGNPSFKTLIARAREVMLGAYANQELPFNTVVEAVAEQHRDISSNPLYQTMFSFHDTPMPDLNVQDMRVTMKPSLETGTSKFDLGVIVYPALVRDAEVNLPATNRATWIIWEYSSDLFDATTIERMASHFKQLLRQVTANPNLTLSELSPLSDQQRHQLLVQWNKTDTIEPGDQCVHELFEAQVERTPDAVAVSFEDHQLTYLQLNQRANQVAHGLMGLGVGPETFVGLYLDRSPELFIGMLGILKAGGAYIPMDVEMPDQRVAFICEDARPDVLLTRQALRPRLAEFGGEVVCVDADPIARQKHETLPCTAKPDNAAYVIYTSGSTGRPKGVLVTHSALATHCAAMRKRYELTPDDRVLQFASTSFDAAMEQIFTTLLSGGQLIVRDAEVWDAQSFVTKCVRGGVTVCNLPTSYWQSVIEQLGESDAAKLRTLRLVIVGGEAMPIEALRAWRRLPLGNIKLLNAYGPTEATITATCYDVPCDETPDSRIPIGTPVGGRSVYVLDANRQAVPIGVAGELYIGGTGLARGYLNRPELTSEKFVSNPFDDDPASRLYRTGDRCRWRADGNLEFLGRLDDQVKLRGYRIELGEIQAVLNEHPDVGQSVVMLREDATASSGLAANFDRAGEKRLVGYCVPRADVELDFVELARYLRTKLPGYMIPAAWVSLESLPLTSGGKLDRQALPTPDADRSTAAGEYLAPRTQIEELLVVAWREVLGVVQIGVHDNYFELGGHSLSAMRVVARVEQRFGVTIPVSMLFELPTIAELATAIETIQERQPAMPPDIDELLATVEAMTEAEAQQLVAKDTVKS